MNDDMIADLKQFITATVSQEISEVREDVRSLEKRLTTRIGDLEKSLADSLDTTNESVDGQLQDHDRRIKLLEQTATA